MNNKAFLSLILMIILSLTSFNFVMLAGTKVSNQNPHNRSEQSTKQIQVSNKNENKVSLFSGSSKITSNSQTILKTNSISSIQSITASNSVTGFISTWHTNYAGTSNYTSINLPLVSTGTYNFTVSWGDGSSNNITSYNQAEVNHTYSTAGNYNLNITGLINGWNFNNSGDVLKLTRISNWGPLQLGNTGSYFNGAMNLVLNATDALNLTNTTNLKSTFQGCTNLGSSGNISNWNTSTITTMNHMFSGATSFNQNITNWDVSHVTDMAYMFFSDSSFNQPLNTWNVSQVTDMNNMFNGAGYNQPLDKWNVSRVTDMNNMFSSSGFNQPLNTWNVSHVTNMRGMFYVDGSFNQPLDKWNVSQVTDMSQMFYFTFFNQPLNTWNVSKVTDMSRMFFVDFSFNQPLDKWNVSQVTNMNNMFYGASLFNQPINTWNVSQVTDMNNMFSGASYFNQPLDKWNVSKVTNMYQMFYQDYVFNQPINTWNVSQVTDMSQMFYGAYAFNRPLDKWNVSQVTDMSGMFYDAQYFNQPLNTWNVSQVTNMNSMLNNTALSITNYNSILMGWSTLPLKSGVVFDVGTVNYSSVAVSARDVLINTFNWIIGDGGLATVSFPPSNFKATSGNDYVYLTWSYPTSDGGNSLTNYTIYRSTTSGSGYLLIATPPNPSFSYNDTSVFNGNIYYYVIVANNEVGSSVYSSEVIGTPSIPPSSPQNVQVSSGNNFVYLTWTAPFSDGGSSVTNYTIYRSTTSGSGYNNISTVTSSTLSFNDTSALNGNTYYYVIVASNTAGSSTYSTEVSAYPFTNPSSPQNVQASSGDNVVYLTWSTPLSDGGNTLTNYTIYRSTTSGSGYIAISTVFASTHSLNDTSALNGNTYYYVIVATNNAGSSVYSTEVSAKPIAPINPSQPSTTSTTTIISSKTNTSPSNSSSMISSNSPGFEMISVLMLLVGLVMFRRRRNS